MIYCRRRRRGRGEVQAGSRMAAAPAARPADDETKLEAIYNWLAVDPPAQWCDALNLVWQCVGGRDAPQLSGDLAAVLSAAARSVYEHQPTGEICRVPAAIFFALHAETAAADGIRAGSDGNGHAVSQHSGTQMYRRIINAKIYLAAMRAMSGGWPPRWARKSTRRSGNCMVKWPSANRVTKKCGHG